MLKVVASSKFGDPKKSGGCAQSGTGSRLSVDPAARHSWVSVCKKEVLSWQKGGEHPLTSVTVSFEMNGR